MEIRNNPGNDGSSGGRRHGDAGVPARGSDARDSASNPASQGSAHGSSGASGDSPSRRRSSRQVGTTGSRRGGAAEPPSAKSPANSADGSGSGNSRTDGIVYDEPSGSVALRRARNFAKNAVKSPTVVVSVLLILFIVFFLKAFLVPSGSMVPTLREGDRIISIARYFPNGSTYADGDIVCFLEKSSNTVFVKRVIAHGGQHVQIVNNVVYVDGVESPWQGTGASGDITSVDCQLGDQEYWVMGDNRGNSQDSRYIGPVEASQMISKVYCIYFPFNPAIWLG